MAILSHIKFCQTDKKNSLLGTKGKQKQFEYIFARCLRCAKIIKRISNGCLLTWASLLGGTFKVFLVKYSGDRSDESYSQKYLYRVKHKFPDTWNEFFWRPNSSKKDWKNTKQEVVSSPQSLKKFKSNYLNMSSATAPHVIWGQSLKSKFVPIGVETLNCFFQKSALSLQN